ncbi:MAG: hypothetical protein ACKORJ_07015 [Bacteroidota bacterium]
MRHVFFAGTLTLAGLLLYGLAMVIPLSSGLRPTFIAPVVTVSLLMNIMSWSWTQRSGEFQDSGRRFLTALVLKMIAQLALVVIVSRMDPQAMEANALFAMVCHITGLSLEVGWLYRRKQG